MKICKGCGAFYNDKCPYCGYSGESIKELPKDSEFITLTIIGNNNDVLIQYGEANRYVVKMVGNNQDTTFKAEYANIVITGNNNDVRVEDKVKYFVQTCGNNNDVR